jgi:DNA adenine methylase
MKKNKGILLPFRYPGGKYYAIKILKPFWESIKHDEYREPLVGGGTVFFAKPKVKHNWINDLHSELIITYKIMADPKSREKLVQMLSNEVASKERHSEVLKFQPKNDLEIAYKYFYLNRTSFSGKMKTPYWGYRPMRSLPPNRWYERIIPCGQKLEDVKITNYDFEQVILAPPMGKTTLLFIDPPYFRSQQEDHYVCSFKHNDHLRLVKILRNTPHKFFLTYDDCEEIRELYDWAYIYSVQFYYRLDNSHDSNGKRQLGSELVITNYPLDDKNKQKTLFDFGYEPEIKPVVTQKIKKPQTIESKTIKSPFRFPGSKAQAIKYIRPFWELYVHDEYREPFVGGGAVFFAKPKVKYNWINDISSDLIKTYKIIADPAQRKILIKRLSVEIATKEHHIEMKNWNPSSDLEIAHRYFYLNRTSYSGIMKKPAWGFHKTKSVPPQRWGPRIEIAGEKLENVKITCLDYHEVINAPPQGENVFLFVDPPYYKADQKRAYQFPFSIDDHIELCRVLKDCQYKFCLTYDNCEEIREMYEWACLHPVSWRYHTANSNKAERKMGNELIITNF